MILNAKDQADVLAWLRRRTYPEPIASVGR